jgi:hypothetical protein
MIVLVTKKTKGRKTLTRRRGAGVGISCRFDSVRHWNKVYSDKHNGKSTVCRPRTPTALFPGDGGRSRPRKEGDRETKLKEERNGLQTKEKIYKNKFGFKNRYRNKNKN